MLSVSPRTVLEIKRKTYAKQYFQTATEGAPVGKLKTGKEDLYEVIQDSPAFTGLTRFVKSDNTKETYSSTISEISHSGVAGPSYDIGETVDKDGVIG